MRTCRVNTPAAVAGDYSGQPATFGPDLPTTPITGAVVYASPNDGCSSLSNKSAVSGNIVIMDRNLRCRQTRAILRSK